MNPIPQIKRVFLKALLRADGLPLPDSVLDDAADQAVVPPPLQSDKNQARRELQSDGFIIGQRDELDPEKTSWGLTVKGQIQAKKISA